MSCTVDAALLGQHKDSYALTSVAQHGVAANKHLTLHAGTEDSRSSHHARPRGQALF